jgi:magnesium transporter
VTEVIHGLGAAERQQVATLRARSRFFWLDASLSETSREDLREALAVPERALPARRPHDDPSASRTLLADGEAVAFEMRCYVPSDAPGSRLRPLTVHVVVTGEYLLTLHEERVSLPAVLALDLPAGRSRRYAVYSVLDTILASTFAALEELELRLDALAPSWADGGGRVPKGTLRDAGTTLAAMRRWMTAEQPVLERVGVEIGALPGFDTDDEPYFDRLDKQVDRLLSSIDAAASGLGMLLDLQLNERAYLLSVLATIFVPLTFITGFFGMNFGWMVGQVDTQIAFMLLGVGVPIAAGVLAWRLLVRPFMSGESRRRCDDGSHRQRR